MGIGPMKTITPVLTELPAVEEMEAMMVKTIPIASRVNPKMRNAVRMLVLLLFVSGRVFIIGFRLSPSSG